MSKAVSSLGRPLKRAQDKDIRKLQRERNKLRGRMKTLKAEIATYREVLEDAVEFGNEIWRMGEGDTSFPPPETLAHMIMSLAHAARDTLDNGSERAKKFLEALQFYGEPETYFGVGFFPDSPAGEFCEDFSDTGELGWKPGKRARVALGWEDEDG